MSLANLREYDYANIGKAIRKLSQEYYEKFVEATSADVPSPAAKAVKTVKATGATPKPKAKKKS